MLRIDIPRLYRQIDRQIICKRQQCSELIVFERNADVVEASNQFLFSTWWTKGEEKKNDKEREKEIKWKYS